LDFDSREAMQSGSLAREGGIDKAIGRKTQKTKPLEVNLASRQEHVSL